MGKRALAGSDGAESTAKRFAPSPRADVAAPHTTSLLESLPASNDAVGRLSVKLSAVQASLLDFCLEQRGLNRQLLQSHADLAARLAASPPPSPPILNNAAQTDLPEPSPPKDDAAPLRLNAKAKAAAISVLNPLAVLKAYVLTRIKDEPPIGRAEVVDAFPGRHSIPAFLAKQPKPLQMALAEGLQLVRPFLESETEQKSALGRVMPEVCKVLEPPAPARTNKVPSGPAFLKAQLPALRTLSRPSVSSLRLAPTNVRRPPTQTRVKAMAELANLKSECEAPVEELDERTTGFLAARLRLGHSLTESDAKAIAKLGFPLDECINAYETANKTNGCHIKTMLWNLVKGSVGVDLASSSMPRLRRPGMSLDAFVSGQPALLGRALRVCQIAAGRVRDFPLPGSMPYERRIEHAFKHVRTKALAAEKDALRSQESLDAPRMEEVEALGDTLAPLDEQAEEPTADSTLAETDITVQEETPNEVGSEVEPSGLSELAQQILAQKEGLGIPDLSDEDSADLAGMEVAASELVDFVEKSRTANSPLRGLIWRILKCKVESGEVNVSELVLNPSPGDDIHAFIQQQPLQVITAIRGAFILLGDYLEQMGDEQKLQSALTESLGSIFRLGRKFSPDASILAKPPPAPPTTVTEAPPDPQAPAVTEAPSVLKTDEEEEEESEAEEEEMAEEETAEEETAEEETAENEELHLDDASAVLDDDFFARKSVMDSEFVRRKGELGVELSDDEARELGQLGFEVAAVSGAMGFLAKRANVAPLKSFVWQLLKDEEINHDGIQTAPGAVDLQAFLALQPPRVTSALKVGLILLRQQGKLDDETRAVTDALRNLRQRKRFQNNLNQQDRALNSTIA